MCVNCSAYSGHTGICPECRKEGFILERSRRYKNLRKIKDTIILHSIGIAVTVILAVCFAVLFDPLALCLLLVTAICGVRIALLLKRRKPINDRILFLTGEINKLEAAMHKGVARI